jgi:hypothetical protein
VVLCLFRIVGNFQVAVPPCFVFDKPKFTIVTFDFLSEPFGYDSLFPRARVPANGNVGAGEPIENFGGFRRKRLAGSIGSLRTSGLVVGTGWTGSSGLTEVGYKFVCPIVFRPCVSF